MTRLVKEIFYSIQGEGANVGTPAVFIRFCGCNLRCPFCDTDHIEGREMGDEEIYREAKVYKAPLIVLTGGEPTLQIDFEFVAGLKEATGARIAIETNGTNPVPENIDWITVSPKIGIEGSDKGDCPILAARADEIKVVDLGQSLDQYFDLPCYGENTLMYLQPCHVANRDLALANRNRTVQRVLENPRWHLSLQIHRLLQIP